MTCFKVTDPLVSPGTKAKIPDDPPPCPAVDNCTEFNLSHLSIMPVLIEII